MSQATYIQPIAYCLLPIACCLLPIAHHQKICMILPPSSSKTIVCSRKEKTRKENKVNIYIEEPQDEINSPFAVVNVVRAYNESVHMMTFCIMFIHK